MLGTELVDTEIGVEVGLNGVENHDGPVSAAAAVMRLQLSCLLSGRSNTDPNLPVAARLGEKAIASWKVSYHRYNVSRI